MTQKPIAESSLFAALFGETATSLAKGKYQALAEDQEQHVKEPESDARKESEPKFWIN